MIKISRYDIADYLNTGTTLLPVWSLLGAGVNTLDENPNAQIDTKIYISDKTSSSTIKSYQTQFPYDADLVKDEAAVMKLYGVGRNHLTGVDAETDYVRVDLYDPCFEGSTQFFKARKFRVCIEVSGAAGAGGESIVSTGNLNCVGDPIEGYFDTVTKTFTEGAYTQTLGALTVTSVAGTTSGTTKITVAEPLTSGNVYMYKTASTVTPPVLDADCSTYTLWNGVADITAVTGNQICIVEVNGSILAKKAGVATVTSKV